MMADSSWSEAKRARIAAARARRRIIFNDDSHDLAQADANTPERFLGHRIAPLVGTQVDTISWSVLCGQFDAPAYDSKVQPIYGDAHGGPMHYWPRVTTNVKALAQSGHCPFRLVVDFAHDHGMEAFASVRMNDVHDSFMGPNAMTVWKLTHQELLVNTRGTLPEFELYTTAQDFSHRAVRDRKPEIIAEICDGYDVDGFELDYIRHPVLFSRRLRGEPCTPDEIKIVTSLMQEIRALTDAAAARRGRPLLVAVRVPDTFGRCLDNGMDVQAWLEHDLTDIIIAGGGYSPWRLPAAAWVAAARPHGVPVYPCANVGWGPPLPVARGLAANWYRAGADGLYFWNLATPFEFMTGDELIATRRRCYACLYEVGDPESLQGKDKQFGVGDAADAPGGVLPYYAHVSSPRPLPLQSKRGPLRTGVIGRVPLLVGDDVEQSPPTTATLTVGFDDPAWREALVVRLNGHELPPGERSADGVLALDALGPLRSGRNFVEIAAHHGPLPESTVRITTLALTVSYEA